MHRVSPFVTDKLKAQDVHIHDQVLVFLRDKFMFVAEFDIVKVSKFAKSTRFDFEPVYIAPPGAGVRADDVLLAQLSSYDSILDWQNILVQQISDINERDYALIVKKLML